MIFMYFEMNGSKLNETRAGTRLKVSKREKMCVCMCACMNDETRNLIENVNGTNYNNNHNKKQEEQQQRQRDSSSENNNNYDNNSDNHNKNVEDIRSSEALVKPCCLF